jgi:hypothetical protein
MAVEVHILAENPGYAYVHSLCWIIAVFISIQPAYFLDMKDEEANNPNGLPF